MTGAGLSHSAFALAWQDVLLARRPNRLALRDCPQPESLARLSLLMLRNHMVESVQAAAEPFFAYAGFVVDWTTSDYDDSLGATAAAAGQDAVVVWLDQTRFALDTLALADWLASRIASIRRASPAPILVIGPEPGTAVDWPLLSGRLSGLAGVYPVPLDAVTEELGGALIDPARAEAMGTRFSRDAQLLIARHLALQWLPAALGLRRKALAIDLDHTLYRGVLGEDGIDGVVLEPGHLALQQALVELGRQGILLTLVTKNDARDVEALFAARMDFPLRLTDCAAWRANWQPKSASITAMAAELNIAADSFLLLDDNPGELAAVAAAIPGLGLLRAAEDAATTVRHLAMAPGLLAFSVSETDRIRAADLAARRIRQSMGDGAGYLASLETSLTLTPDPADQLERLVAVSAKTNQFNLALARLSAAEIAAAIEAPDRCVVALALRDQLSDSGNVGAIHLRRDGDDLHIDELCISCRALGRNLEDIMVGAAVTLAAGRFGLVPRRVWFHALGGPRNQPALEWLGRLTSKPGPAPDELTRLAVDYEAVAQLGRTELAEAVSIVVGAG